MRIAVFGVGGVGGYFGGRLAQAGHEVALIARGAHLEAIRSDGLRIASPRGDALIRPAIATSDPAEVGPVDLVLVGVKSWQMAEAARAMGPLIGPETAALPLLNGVEASDILAAALGPGHALGGLCRIIAMIAGPGQIRHAGLEPTVLFGELDNRRTPRVEQMLAAFTEAGVQAQIPADIQVAIWEKFMLIAAWSSIGAVTRVPVGAWRSLPETRALAEQALAETVALAHARGVNLSPTKIAASLAFFDAAPSGGTASMQRDIADGRPSELDDLGGAVVRLAAAAGVATPIHKTLYAALLPQERAARGL